MSRAAAARRRDPFLAGLAGFREFGQATLTETDAGIPYFINEFWTSGQRRSHAIHEVSYRACFKAQLPEFFIRQASGKAPADFFQEPFGFSGSHDKTCEMVEAGRFAVGVVNYKVYDRRVADGTTDPAVCKVIWRTPEYADYNFTAHPDLETTFGAGFTDKLQAALVGITDPQLLAALPRDKLIPARNEEFDGIAAVARDLGMLR